MELGALQVGVRRVRLSLTPTRCAILGGALLVQCCYCSKHITAVVVCGSAGAPTVRVERLCTHCSGVVRHHHVVVVVASRIAAGGATTSDASGGSHTRS